MISDEVVLAVGDSLVFGMRKDLFPGIVLVNQGVPGDETTDVIRRLNRYGLIAAQTIFVLVGINDFLRNEKQMITRDEKSIVANIVTIGLELKQDHPSSEVIISSLLPVSQHEKYVRSEDVMDFNLRIDRLNRRLRETLKKTTLIYLDLHSILLANGMLDHRFTTDGIHLSLRGYDTLRDALLPYFTNKVS